MKIEALGNHREIRHIRHYPGEGPARIDGLQYGNARRT
jgi:hypothetical protein